MAAASSRAGRLLRLVVALALLAGACSSGTTDATLERSAPATAATAPSTPSSVTTTTVAAGAPQPAPPQVATPTCPAVPARVPPPPDRPTYVLDVDVRLAENVVEGRTTVRFRPDLPTDRLVFRLWPNAPRTAGAGARLDVGAVLVGAHPAATEQPDPTTLVVQLGGTLRPGDGVEAVVPWRLALPGPVNDRISRDGDAVRLGSFFPILAWEPGLGWAVEPPTALFAEASSAPVADFLLSVTAPPGLTVLASGEPDGPGRWRALAVRDVALSVGRFEVAEGVAHAPRPVRVTVGAHAPLGVSPQPYLDQVVRSLEDFAARFGPYPYRSYTVGITPHLSGGIEYPGHVLQGPDTLGRTTSHEVGHMWFYSLVGNNQGRHPWLDEGLATWAEARFEGTLAGFRGRPVPAVARGRLGEPMAFWDGHAGAYYRGVYVQGAQALADLGAPELVDCALRHYVAANAYRIASPADLAEALRTVFPDAEAVLAQYGVRA